MRILVVGGGGREHAIVRALARSRSRAGAALRARQRRASRPTPAASRSAPRTSAGSSPPRPPSASTWWWSGPRRRWSPGSSTRSRRAGIAAFGPRAEAARIEGSKVHAKELMAAAGVPTASHTVLRSREEALEHLARASYPAVLKADGLAAGKGVIIAADRGRGAGGGGRLLRRAALRRRRRSCWRSTSRARSSRCWRSATARTWCRWPRRRTTSGSSTATAGPNTGGMGSYSPVPGFDRARTEEIADAVHRPIVDLMRRRGTPYHGRALRGPDDHRGRARRCSSSTAASAIPRPRPCCRGCAPTWSSSASRRARARRPGGRGAEFGERLGGDGRARLARAIPPPRRRGT